MRRDGREGFEHESAVQGAWMRQDKGEMPGAGASLAHPAAAEIDDVDVKRARTVPPSDATPGRALEALDVPKQRHRAD